MGEKLYRIQDRFEQKVIRGYQDDTCWKWTGAERIMINGKRYVPHHVAYRLYIGKKPKGKSVIRSCKNPNCVNPRHLKLAGASSRTFAQKQEFISVLGEQTLNRCVAGTGLNRSMVTPIINDMVTQLNDLLNNSTK